MAIEFSCECGKRFRARDEYEGRRGICPACHREFVIQRLGPPVFHDADAEQTPQTMPRATAEGKPDSGTDPQRSMLKDPVVAVGAAVPALILFVFFGYLAWPKLHAYWHPKPDPRRILATDYIRRILEGVLQKDPARDRFRVSYVEATPIPDDRRKLPDLWKAWALVDLKESPGALPAGGNWDFIYQFDPATGRGAIVRFSYYDPVQLSSHDGGTNRSEWKDEFRSVIKAAWRTALAERRGRFKDFLSDESMMAAEERKRELAAQFDLTIEEFKQILATGE